MMTHMKDQPRSLRVAGDSWRLSFCYNLQLLQGPDEVRSINLGYPRRWNICRFVELDFRHSQRRLSEPIFTSAQCSLLTES